MSYSDIFRKKPEGCGVKFQFPKVRNEFPDGASFHGDPDGSPAKGVCFGERSSYVIGPPTEFGEIG